MQLPFCKICGERHGLGFCPDFGPIAAPVKVAKIAPKVSDKVPDVPGPPLLPGKSGGGEINQPVAPPFRFLPEHMKQETMPLIKPRFDRNAYQRELMRKRRAR